MKVAFVYFNYGIPLMDIGLSQMMTIVKKNNHKVFLVDPTFHFGTPEKFIITCLTKISPDVIFYSGTNYVFNKTISIANKIKFALPKVKQIWGGTFATLAPEIIIRNKAVDGVLRGESEATAIEYLSSYKNEKKLRNIEGLWFRTLAGKIEKNTKIPLIEDLNSLPNPDHEFWNMEKYLRSGLTFSGEIMHFASKGCPYSCSFCNFPAINRLMKGRHYRLKNPEKVIEEIQSNYHKYHDKGFNIVNFCDPVFGLNKEHFNTLLELYIKSGLNKKLPYVCQTRPELMTQKFVKKLKDSGCIYVSTGLESGVDHIRNKIYNKRTKKEHYEKAISNLKKNKIEYRINYIYDGPGETWKTIKEGLNYAVSLKSSHLEIIKYWPLIGTEAYSKIEKENIIQDNFVDVPTYNKKRKWVEQGKIDLYFKIMKLKFFFRKIFLCFKFRKILFLWDVLINIINIKNFMILVKYPIYFFQYHLSVITHFNYILTRWKNETKNTKNNTNN